MVLAPATVFTCQ